MNLQPFHPTLQKAIDEGIRYLNDQGAVFNPDELREPFTFDGVSYGTSRESHCVIQTLKGRRTQKYGHLTIWRSSNGQYEVNAYIL